MRLWIFLFTVSDLDEGNGDGFTLGGAAGVVGGDRRSRPPGEVGSRGTLPATSAPPAIALIMTLIAHIAPALLSRTDAGSARPPPPPLPNPCWANSTGEPQFHVTNMGTGPHDANAIL